MGNYQQDAKQRRRKKAPSLGHGPDLPQSAADARAQWESPHQGVLPIVGPADHALESMSADDEGRFVFCPKQNGDWHLYWKWHGGRWRGYYEYWYKSRAEGWGDALQGLTDRIADVYGGRRRPKRDTPRPDG
jgi:hypothetical protein